MTTLTMTPGEALLLALRLDQKASSTVEIEGTRYRVVDIRRVSAEGYEVEIEEPKS